jgi:hypothetical protein
MEEGRAKAQQLGALLGCSTQNTKEMVDCLRHRPAQQIVQQCWNFQVMMVNDDVHRQCHGNNQFSLKWISLFFIIPPNHHTEEFACNFSFTFLSMLFLITFTVPHYPFTWLQTFSQTYRFLIVHS